MCTTLRPTPTVSIPSSIPSVNKIPISPIPQHIKLMRFLLVFTLFFSAYAIYSSIILTRLTFNVLPTAALAVWTLFMLFPLELDHHEGVAQSERHLMKWIVDQKIVLNSQRTAAAWGVSAVRTVFFALMGMSAEQKAEWQLDVWVLAALEAASCACLYVLADKWTAENWKQVQAKEAEKKEVKAEGTKKSAVKAAAS